MGATPDTTAIDGHECEMVLVDDSIEPHEIDEDTEFECRHCGTRTTPSRGVKQAKRNRRW